MKSVIIKYVASLFILCLIGGCAQKPNTATTGALTGGALGAGLGAIIGNQSGHPGAGVAIGAAAGAIGGGLFGNSMDKQKQETARQQEQLALTQQQIDENQRLINELKGKGLDARSTERGVVINLPDVLFQFDSYRLTGEAKNTVNEIASTLKSIPGRGVAVEGHTDSVGSFDYNKRLSLDRATSVANALEQDGVSRGRIEIHGYGEGKPIASNSTDAGRNRNRRVEVIVKN